MDLLDAKKKLEKSYRYKNDYNKRVYDRFSLMLPAGEKDRLKKAAAERGESLNAYISVSYTHLENDLVPVYETDKGIKVVYGTELHSALEVKSNYREWANRRFSDCLLYTSRCV